MANRCGWRGTMSDQRYVLAVLYYSTNGDTWTYCSAPPRDTNDENGIARRANEKCNLTTANATVLFPNDIRGTDAWLTPSNECLWGGVSCYGPGTEFLPWNRKNDNDDDEVMITKKYTMSAIEFENNNLVGTLPEEIGLGLPNLRFLALERERLTGTIPSSYGNLINLLLLDFDFNTLSGELPDALWKLRSLRQLDLNNNDFTGTISEDIGLLNDLRFFQIDNNKMSGTIPRTMGDIENLSESFFCFNLCSWSCCLACSELCCCKPLSRIFQSLLSFLFDLLFITGLIGLSENYFTGSMPTEICDLRPSPLETLVVDCINIHIFKRILT